MRAHQESTPEYVPVDQFYPHTTAVDLPQTLEDAIAYYESGHDLNKHAEVLAYWGSPAVQADIILEAANALINDIGQTKTEARSENNKVHVHVTHSVPSVEPLVFYWQRTNQFDSKIIDIQANPTMYVDAVLKALNNIGAKQLAVQVPSILKLAEIVTESQAKKLKDRVRELGGTVTEKVVLSVVPPLDQRRVA